MGGMRQEATLKASPLAFPLKLLEVSKMPFDRTTIIGSDQIGQGTTFSIEDCIGRKDREALMKGISASSTAASTAMEALPGLTLVAGSDKGPRPIGGDRGGSGPHEEYVPPPKDPDYWWRKWYYEHWNDPKPGEKGYVEPKEK